jgi:GT2 family glycosyltransferase
MAFQAFGEDAARIAGRISRSTSVVACEPTYASSALATAVSLRRAGQRFYASVFWDDPRDRTARERSIEASARYATLDEVRLIMNEFVDALPRRRAIVSDEDRGSLHEFIRLSSGLVIRSWTEFVRIEVALGTLPREAFLGLQEPELAVEAGAARTDIVVYAPFERADALGAFTTALGDVDLPVTIVARDAPAIASRCRFVTPAAAAVALGRARAIVDAGRNDPGTSLALARLGVPLAVPSAGGALEVLTSVTSFEPWNRRSILAAAIDALGSDPPRIRATYRAMPLHAPAEHVPPANAPLISVVIATHDRPQLLDAVLTSIDRQTYPNVETIVVNDAGSDVAAVVARHPHARLIDHTDNRGPAAARNTGARAATGEFVIFFDDDDEMFPDHLTALGNAATRTGLDVAYGQMINCFVIPAGTGRFAVDGLLAHYALLDHAEIAWGPSIATTAVLIRRSLLAKVGYLDETIAGAEDYDLWLRLAEGREWARVSDVTSIYYVRADKAQRSARTGHRGRHYRSYATIYAKHPTDRPLIRAGRVAMLEAFDEPVGDASTGDRPSYRDAADAGSATSSRP